MLVLDRFQLYDCFPVTGAHDTVLDHAAVTLHDDIFQDFDSRWDEVPLFMSEIPSDDILESLYKLRKRESVQFKNGDVTVIPIFPFSNLE